jgi:hypothetical protein
MRVSRRPHHQATMGASSAIEAMVVENGSKRFERGKNTSTALATLVKAPCSLHSERRPGKEFRWLPYTETGTYWLSNFHKFDRDYVVIYRGKRPDCNSNRNQTLTNISRMIDNLSILIGKQSGPIHTVSVRTTGTYTDGRRRTSIQKDLIGPNRNAW